MHSIPHAASRSGAPAARRRQQLAPGAALLQGFASGWACAAAKPRSIHAGPVGAAPSPWEHGKARAGGGAPTRLCRELGMRRCKAPVNPCRPGRSSAPAARRRQQLASGAALLQGFAASWACATAKPRSIHTGPVGAAPPPWEHGKARAGGGAPTGRLRRVGNAPRQRPDHGLRPSSSRRSSGLRVPGASQMAKKARANAGSAISRLSRPST